MDYLTDDEAEAFYLASLREYDMRFIGDHALYDRMRALAEMMTPDSRGAVQQAFHLPGIAEVEENPNESAPEIYPSPERRDGGGQSGRSSLPPPVMELIVQNVKGMQKWEFRKSDPDHFPSVPHGHEYGLDWPVCDPYTGRVYDGDREEMPSSRLSRKTRVALWKDSKFRAFALASILHHQTSFPYRPIRVKRPTRLPTIFRH